KKIVVLSLLAATMLLNAGCTDDEVAAGAIGVAIGIGLGAGDHHDHYRPGPYRPHHHWSAQENISLPTEGASKAVVVGDASAQDSQIADFAFKYNINLDQATKVQAAFDGVQKQGLDSFAAVGLSKADIQALMKHSQPASSAIAAVAGKLDMSEAQSRDFLVSMNHEFEAQASDVQSAYWQSCMAKGKWKTPENAYCTTGEWGGCSPAQGATLCY
ncbi:MAG TPA: hypothetical protein VN132_13510, partial [Bdellovibrio sp.]|nr:hypothetical protein [Bdellovibrio sp.]